MPSTTRSRSRSRSRSQRQAPTPSPQQPAKIPRQPRSRRSPPGSSSDSKNSSSSRTHTRTPSRIRNRTPSRTRNRTPSRTQTRSSTRKAAAASTLRNQHSAVSSSSKETTAEVMELPRRTNALFALIRKFSGGPFISRQGARSLILWSYLSGPDPSILAPWLYPMWTMGASLLPRRWSPNVVTLTGFTLVLAMNAVVWHKCGLDCAAQPDYEAFSSWLFPLAALLLWGYQTADAMDGRQGKRVGMYVHPSTELFDHGVDGVVTSVSGLASVALLGLGSSPMWGAAHLCCLLTAFYMTTYEHLIRGLITFDKGLSNPTEGLVVVLTLFLSLAYSPRWMEHTVDHALTQALFLVPAAASPSLAAVQALLPGWAAWLPLKHALVVTEMTGLGTLLLSSLIRSVWTEPTSVRPGMRRASPHSPPNQSNDSTDSTAPPPPPPPSLLLPRLPYKAMAPLLPLCLTWLFAFLCFFPHSHPWLAALPPLATPHLRPLLMLLCAFANTAILRLIICEMTKSSFPAMQLTATGALHLALAVAIVVATADGGGSGTGTAVPLAALAGLGLLRFAGLWFRFQYAIVHYCGMPGPLGVQQWPEAAPNAERLQKAHLIAWLVDPSTSIDEGADAERDNALMRRQHVPLLP